MNQHEHLLRVFNLLLVDSHVEEKWKQTTLSMILKTKDLTNLRNWRPLAILNITYKIFSSYGYKCVKPVLEARQSKDQIGFRSFVGVGDAFAVFENVCCIEYNALFDALTFECAGGSTCIVETYSFIVS